jgi:hypothetical protein
MPQQDTIPVWWNWEKVTVIGVAAYFIDTLAISLLVKYATMMGYLMVFTFVGMAVFVTILHILGCAKAAKNEIIAELRSERLAPPPFIKG